MRRLLPCVPLLMISLALSSRSLLGGRLAPMARPGSNGRFSRTEPFEDVASRGPTASLAVPRLRTRLFRTGRGRRPSVYHGSPRAKQSC